MEKNKYSRYKFENTFNLKYSVNSYTRETSVLNNELTRNKTSFNANYLNNQDYAQLGQTYVVDYVYKAQQVYSNDLKVPCYNTIERLFFKPF